MRDRCNNAKHIKFEGYGARGINVCERWAKFENFLLDMGRKPRPDLTLERLDNNGSYDPTNCVWASKKEQARNKRNTVEVTYQGKKMRLVELVGALGLSRATVYGRLKIGWPLDVAIALPIRDYKK